MSKLKFQNCSNDYIKIIFLDEDLIKILEPNNSFDLTSKQDSMLFIIKKHVDKKSILSQIIEIIIAFLVSIPLWFINYFEIELIDKSIQFPTKFQIFNLANDVDYNIIINNSSEKYKAFNLKVNNEFISGEIEYSKKEFDSQIQEYKKSLLISWLFPILVIVCLLIASLYLKNLILFLIVFFIVGLLIFFLAKTCKKNNFIINKIKQEFN